MNLIYNTYRRLRLLSAGCDQSRRLNFRINVSDVFQIRSFQYMFINFVIYASLKICCILLKFSPFSMLPTSRAWNLRINLYRLDIVGWQVRVMCWCLLLFLGENGCTWGQFLILTGEHFQIKSCTLKERFYEAFSEKPKNCYTYSPSRKIVLVQNRQCCYVNNTQDYYIKDIWWTY